MAQSIETQRLKPDEVDARLTKHLMGIALDAWTAGLGGARKREEVQTAFDPYDPDAVAAMNLAQKDDARHGRFLIAHQGKTGPVIGFAVVRNNVFPKGKGVVGAVARTEKRALTAAHNHIGRPKYSRKHPNRVYARVEDIAVQTDAPRGTGTRLLRSTLNYFHPEQISTVYIEDANKTAQEFFTGLGYEYDGKSEEPVHRYGYQREGDLQRRYIAPVKVVLGQTAARLANIENA